MSSGATVGGGGGRRGVCDLKMVRYSGKFCLVLGCMSGKAVEVIWGKMEKFRNFIEDWLATMPFRRNRRTRRTHTPLIHAVKLHPCVCQKSNDEFLYPDLWFTVHRAKLAVITDNLCLQKFIEVGRTTTVVRMSRKKSVMEWNFAKYWIFWGLYSNFWQVSVP